MSQAWFVGIHIRQKGSDPDSIDLLSVSTGLTESLALLCQTLPGNEAQKYQEPLSNDGWMAEGELSWMFHDFPSTRCLDDPGCLVILVVATSYPNDCWNLLDNVAYDPWAKTKTIENPRAMSTWFPVISKKQPMEVSSRWMGKVFNYQRDTNHYQSMFFLGFFPGWFRQELLSSLQKVEVQDRDEVRRAGIPVGFVQCEIWWSHVTTHSVITNPLYSLEL